MADSKEEDQSRRNLNDAAVTTKRRKVAKEPLRIGLLGCGAINSKVAEMIMKGEAGPAILTAVLVRKERSEEELKSLLPYDCRAAATVTTAADEFFSTDSNWSLCIEAAGQPTVKEYAKRCLQLGRDFMITSIGSLTNESLYDDLHATAEANGSRLILCTGSMPAVDWMGSAALDSCTEVKVTQTKPPKAWLGTKALVDYPDLLKITEPCTLFEGSARKAATMFPKNANVAAMLALATAGLDETRASLVANPNATGNLVEISFVGPAGKIKVQVEAAPSTTNPRTSAIVALSVVKAVRKLCCPVIVGL
jgi:aspartate dehydrogenase